MFYSTEDMQRLSGYEDMNLTPFEMTACKALAFGDNLALCVAFDTLTKQINVLDERLSEAKESNNVSEETDAIAMDSGLIAVTLLTAMESVILEV